MSRDLGSCTSAARRFEMAYRSRQRIFATLVDIARASIKPILSFRPISSAPLRFLPSSQILHLWIMNSVLADRTR